MERGLDEGTKTQIQHDIYYEFCVKGGDLLRTNLARWFEEYESYKIQEFPRRTSQLRRG